MRLFCIVLALATVAGSTTALRADTITTFALTGGSFTNGSTATGTVTIDTTTGHYTAEDLSIHSGRNTYLFDSAITPSEQGLVYHSDAYAFNVANGQNDFLDFSVPTTSGLTLSGYDGGDICSNTNLGSCDSFAGGYIPASGNAATWDTGALVAETPEPSSLLLLLTGVVGMVLFAIRRRERDGR